MHPSQVYLSFLSLSFFYFSFYFFFGGGEFLELFFIRNTLDVVSMNVSVTTGRTPKEVSLRNFIVLTRLYIELYPSQLNNYLRSAN